MKLPVALLFFLIVTASCSSLSKSSDLPPARTCQLTLTDPLVVAVDTGIFEALHTSTAVVIDGCDEDPIWSKTSWYSMNYAWMGAPVDSTDYHGMFKLAWNRDYLYLLVAVTDEHLNPTLQQGIENYWKGDYVEVFIDEDQSGGNHQFNHQAFAYHVSTEGHAIDKGISQQTVFLDNHVQVKRTQQDHTYLWELAIKIYDNRFDERLTDQKALSLAAQKTMGFSIAYGDNDGQHTRENFMGSKKTHGVNNDEGYVNASVFGQVTLIP